MCGHGTIGLVASLAHAGRLGAGALAHRHSRRRRSTPSCMHDGAVDVANVPSYRKAQGVVVEVPGFGAVRGDVAWGGNWFFLVEAHGQESSLAQCRGADRFHLARAPGTERAGLSTRSITSSCSALSPNRRRPTAATSCCVPARPTTARPAGQARAPSSPVSPPTALDEGEAWIQESLVGSTFTAHFRWLDRAAGTIAPTIRGRAHVTAESALLLDPLDPFCWGIP